MRGIRSPAVAGSFYPAETEKLKGLLEECFVANPLGPRGVRAPLPSLLGGMVPHAGFIYSGACAAHFYYSLERDIERVILLGVNHRGRGPKAAFSPAGYWETPLGRVRVDQALQESLRDAVDFLVEDERAHLEEHSIEVQLPFLQTVLKEFSFLPLSLSYLSVKECERLGEAIAEVYESERVAGRRALLIASSDLSHYLTPAESERRDGMALEQVLALDPVGLLKTVEEEEITMCGVFPTAVFLFAARVLEARHARLLRRYHSGDAVPMREVVGYASVAVEF